MANNLYMRENNKLKGIVNYYVWSLKLKTILLAKGLWAYTEIEIATLASFLATIDGKSVTTQQLKKHNVQALKIIIMLVADDLIIILASQADLARAWKALKDYYQAGDQNQVLTVLKQLQQMRIAEGGSVEEYLKKAREMKNWLARIVYRDILQLS